LISTQKISWKFFLFPLLYTLAFNQFAFITADPDLWGHIKFGKEIWTQASFTPTNYYSYTAPDHPWINHEWLAEIIFYLIFSLGGSTGLLIFKLLLGFVTVHLICAYNLKTGANPWALMGSMALTIPALAPGFMVRPHLWTILFFTIFLYLLNKGLQDKLTLLYWIPFLMLVWVNCHGGVVAGLAVYAVVTLIEGSRSIITGTQSWKPLLASFLFSCLAVLINPHGMGLWDFFYHSLSVPRNITEWNPVPLPGTQFFYLKFLTILFIIVIFLPGKKPFWKIMVTIACIYFGFKHQRHSVLTVIALAFFLPELLSSWIQRWKDENFIIFKTNFFYFPAKLILSIFIILQFLDGFSKYNQNQFKVLVEPTVYPSYLAQFMKENKFEGNILVPFDWGEYFIWHLPGSRVSIDGRFRTAYPESVINWNQEVYSNPEVLNFYPTDFIVLRKKDATKDYLIGNNNWIKIYEDLIAILFVRKNLDSILRKFEKKQFVQSTEPPSMNFP
jgi:hypothetical protein